MITKTSPNHGSVFSINRVVIVLLSPLINYLFTFCIYLWWRVCPVS